MNEFALARSMNNTILDLCNNMGFTRVRKILLKVGVVKDVNPELMVSAFAMLAKGKVTEGALLAIMFVPLTLNCYDCGNRGYRDDNKLKCPKCGSQNVKLITGLEFSIESIEVEKNLS